MIENKVPSDLLIPNSDVWESCTENYELTLQYNRNTLLVMLDTAHRNFREQFDDYENNGFSSVFLSVKDIFEKAQNSKMCRVDFQSGILVFSFQPRVGQKEREAILPIKECQLNEFMKMELFVRRLVRRQNKLQQMLVSTSQQYKHQMQRLKKFVEETSQFADLKISHQIAELKREFQFIQEQQRTKSENRDQRIKQEIQFMKKSLNGKQQIRRESQTSPEMKRVRREIEELLDGKRQSKSFGKKSFKDAQDMLKLTRSRFDQLVEKSTDLQKHSKKIYSYSEIQDIFLDHPEKLVDFKSNPHSKQFKVYENNITLLTEHQEDEILRSKHILLDTVIGKEVFCFRTRVNKTKCGWINIGLLDRLRDHNQTHKFGIASYCGSASGTIYFVKNGIKRKVQTAIEMREGMSVLVEVNVALGTICFTLDEDHSLNKKHYSLQTPTIQEPHRQLVPYFVMYHAGDSIEWQIC